MKILIKYEAKEREIYNVESSIEERMRKGIIILEYGQYERLTSQAV